MDSQEGITGTVFAAIRDQLVKKNDWGAITGSVIILQQLVLQAWAFHLDKKFTPFDVPTIGLIVLIFLVLGIRSIGNRAAVQPTQTSSQ